MKLTIAALRTRVEGACQRNPHLTSRIEKAAFIVLLRPIKSSEEGEFQVASEDGLRWYRVVSGHCECYDYARHGPGHPCKHRLAIWLSGLGDVDQDHHIIR